MSSTTGRTFWLRYGFYTAVVLYLVIEGVFVIEQIEVREEMLRRVNAQESKVLGALAAVAASAPSANVANLQIQQKKLSAVRARLTGLSLTGAMTEGSTIPSIACDIIRLEEPRERCQDPRPHGFGKLFLVVPIQQTSSGTLFAWLIVVGAIAGSLTRLSLADREERDRQMTVMTLLQAIGGGVVCYLLLCGGTFPTLTSPIRPATAGFMGFLAGLFSGKVFLLLSNWVDRSVERLSPALPVQDSIDSGFALPSRPENDVRGELTTRADEGHHDRHA